MEGVMGGGSRGPIVGRSGRGAILAGQGRRRLPAACPRYIGGVTRARRHRQSLRDLRRLLPRRRRLHRSGHLDGKRRARFPLARQALDAEQADPLRGFPRQRRGAPRGVAAQVRDGRPLPRTRARAAAITRSPPSSPTGRCRR